MLADRIVAFDHFHGFTQSRVGGDTPLPRLDQIADACGEFHARIGDRCHGGIELIICEAGQLGFARGEVNRGPEHSVAALLDLAARRKPAAFKSIATGQRLHAVERNTDHIELLLKALGLRQINVVQGQTSFFRRFGIELCLTKIDACLE